MNPPYAASFYLTHLPHVVPIVGVFGAIGWGYYKRLSAPPIDEREPERWLTELDQRRRAWRGRSLIGGVARRGLYALGPLLAATATGAVVYGIDIGGGHPGTALAWFHSGIAILASLLVTYKLAELGATRLRGELTSERLLDTALSFLLLFLIPLLILTGVWLLFEPSSSSFMAYAHLITSAWWTLLLVVHLRRYLRRSLRDALGRETVSPAASPEAPPIY